MILIFLRVMFIVVSSGLGIAIINSPELMGWSQSPLAPTLVFSGLMLFSLGVIAIDILIPKKKIDAITAVYFGLIVGLFISYMVSLALTPLYPDDLIKNSPFLRTLRPMVQLIIATFTCYITTSLLLQTRNDFRVIIPYVEFKKDVKGAMPYILDTSAVIDGRIADIIDTGIFDSPLLMPRSVISEIQAFADSSDKLRRVRGRRGLDILNRLRNDANIDLEILESEPKELLQYPEDDRLVILARKMEGKLITSDYNLSKVAQLHGVPVLNLNDLSNALKQNFVPGEQLEVQIVKNGEEANQGIGYLSDGTMVVVENARQQIGNNVRIVITSLMQTSAGRLVFGKIQSCSSDSPVGDYVADPGKAGLSYREGGR